jgi:hypothetical protein
MPRLVLFAACEKAIIDQNTNVLSLMSLLQDINVQLPPGITPPPNTAIPMSWTIVSVWQQAPADQGKTFEQRCTLVTQSGATLMETPVAGFETKTEFHRVINQVMGLHINPVGSRLVKCFMREKSSAHWAETGTYPISIKWVTTGQPVIH